MLVMLTRAVMFRAICFSGGADSLSSISFSAEIHGNERTADKVIRPVQARSAAGQAARLAAYTLFSSTGRAVVGIFGAAPASIEMEGESIA